MANTLTAAAGSGGCWKEQYCYEVTQGRPACKGNRCLFGGHDHPKPPCPDHDRPFGLDVAEGGTATTTKPTKPRKPKKPARRPKTKAAGRRKVTARKAPARKAPKKTKKKKATKKTRR